MLEIDFVTFQELIKRSKTLTPAIHCLETSVKFVFVMRTESNWKYFTTVTKEQIIMFGDEYGGSDDQVIEEFRTNYCSYTIPLVSEEGITSSLITKGVITKSDVIEAGEDVLEESDDYKSFLDKMVNIWERETIKALDDLTPVIDKTFNNVFAKITGIFSTVRFMQLISKFVKKGLLAGMESAEEELDVQIGFTQTFNQKMQILSDQQLTGYTINGKKWHGIKGVAQDMQTKIMKSIRDDVIDKVPRKEMVENIQSIYQGVGKNHAEMIAQTETNRFINEGKLTGYKEAGFKKKSWSTVGDSHVSDIDKRLEKKYQKGIPVDDPFIDDVTGKAFMTPPSHPRCRCTLEARFD